MERYELDSAENKAFVREMRNSLLSFGHRFPSPGGGSYYLGDDGTPWKDRPRETWITSRMCHVYSLGAMLGHEGSEALADAALKGLAGELHDDEHGGWYAGLTVDGEVLPNKQCYAHGFVILAASSALLAKRPGAKELLEDALAVYDKFFWNEELGLSADTWNTEFTVCDDYRGINANMHTVEAFLAAADALKNENYRVRAGRIINHVVNWARENNWRIPEHFTSDWKPDLQCNKDKPDDQFKPYGATPGHGIEWARLITQWAVSTYGKYDNENAKDYIVIAEKLYNRAVEDGWNADGEPGICYTTDWDGKPVVHDRMHWTLAEAINTSAVLYRVTGNEKYKEDYAAFMEYLDEKVYDKATGSWFHQLDEHNNVIGTVWPGKSDIYHALQATMIPYNDLVGVSIASAVARGNS
ncbi:MAG: AGE family epimerase/isomerase [Pseudobutyrivibrio ruminis]|uniref:AGE family epimerase/isomerase n=1 Tax=Pseudobutyrivibrio ruminis TaxID=46206 RepID=UPI0026EB04DF|nr:AGE family epimerase/isomerase [Pseudobutyrivibrio ruminis]MBE5913743.1 AGE family epimerase/isomerase [Pseudobutyrivibrio ruminis]